VAVAALWRSFRGSKKCTRRYNMYTRAKRALRGTWGSYVQEGAHGARRRGVGVWAGLGNRQAHALARARWPTSAPLFGKKQAGGEAREERDR